MNTKQREIINTVTNHIESNGRILNNFAAHGLRIISNPEIEVPSRFAKEYLELLFDHACEFANYLRTTIDNFPLDADR